MTTVVLLPPLRRPASQMLACLPAAVPCAACRAVPRLEQCLWPAAALPLELDHQPQGAVVAAHHARQVIALVHLAVQRLRDQEVIQPPAFVVGTSVEPAECGRRRARCGCG